MWWRQTLSPHRDRYRIVRAITNGLKHAYLSNRGIHNLEKYARTFFAGLVLAGISFGVTACTQAPAPVAAAPAETNAPTPPAPVIVEETHPTVVERMQPRGREERRPRVGVDIDIRKQQDRDQVSVDLHARP